MNGLVHAGSTVHRGSITSRKLRGQPGGGSPLGNLCHPAVVQGGSLQGKQKWTQCFEQ